jgi:hypothetical protein
VRIDLIRVRADSVEAQFRRFEHAVAGQKSHRQSQEGSDQRDAIDGPLNDRQTPPRLRS